MGLKGLRVQSCLKWLSEMPTLEYPQESEIFHCHGYDRYFRLSLNPKKSSWVFLHLITKNLDEEMEPFEMSVYVETPNELKFFSRVSIEDPAYCISSYMKEEVTEIMRHLRWKSIPFVFVFSEAVELKLSSGEYGMKSLRYSSDFESLSNDFGQLRSDKSSDILLVCEDEEFCAHRHILYARGKRFEDEFRGWNFVARPFRIEGVAKEIFSEILHYCYNAKLTRKLTLDFARRLYEAAQKYGIDQLARKCAVSLTGSLNPENIYDILILARSQKDKDLEKSAIAYLFKHKIPLQEGWTKFSRTPGADQEKRVELALDVYHEFYRSRCSE